MAGERLIPLLALQFQVYIWMDGGGEEQKMGKKQPLLSRTHTPTFYLYHSNAFREDNTATVGVSQKEGRWALSI